MRIVLIFCFTVTIFINCTNNRSKLSSVKLSIGEDIYRIDRDKPVESFAELTNLFAGKPVYIDRWATWCGICVDEFRYADSLQAFLKKNNIEMVYLNSDQEIGDSTLNDFIISHNLKGYHLRLNNTLKNDLIQLKIFRPSLPQYMVVDKSGNILLNNALRPSDGARLFKQLKRNILI
jgi:thiol-disulfide isomerase/thioredoxin